MFIFVKQKGITPIEKTNSMKTYQISTTQVVHNGCLFTELYNVSEYVTIKINPMGGTFTSGENEIFVKEKTEYYINLLNFVENNY